MPRREIIFFLLPGAEGEGGWNHHTVQIMFDHGHASKKNPGPYHFGHFWAPERREGGGVAPFRDPLMEQKNPGIFAPRGGGEIQELLKVGVQKHQ